MNVKVMSRGVIEVFPRWFLKGYNLLPPANEVWGKVIFRYGQQAGGTYPTVMHSC